MKILVTGATGFIGVALCDKLVAEGHEVTALTRDPDTSKSRVSSVKEFYAWGPHDF